MTPTPRAQTYRAHKAAKNARRKLNDPVLRAAVMANVFGKEWVPIVELFGRRRAS